MATDVLVSPTIATPPLINEFVSQRNDQKPLYFYQHPAKSSNGKHPEIDDLPSLIGPHDRWPRTIDDAYHRWKGVYTEENASTILAHEPIELHNGWLVWRLDQMSNNHWPKNIIEAYERSRGPYTIENIEIIIDQESIELFNGWLVWKKMTNPIERGIVANVHDVIRPFAHKIGYGKVYHDNTEFVMNDGSTLIPDLCLISWVRWRKQIQHVGRNQRPTFMGGPELVVEARSPSNTRKEDREKREKYFANNVKFVWDVDEVRRKIWVYQASAPNAPIEYGIGDEITCELLPGWRRKVADIFAKDEIPLEAIAGEIMEESREEGIAIGEERGIAIGEERGIAIGEERGIAIGEERGIRQNILDMLPMFAQVRFGQALSSNDLQRLQTLDLATLQTLQATVATTATVDDWLSQI
ncbi:MAG: Uma2 family endonuclease [Chloroflexota bacterium]